MDATMNVESALSEIRFGFKRMASLYGEPVFDEWVLVALADSTGAIQGYEGPRASEFLASFTQDIATLRAELAEEDLDVGGFTFGAATHGHTYDAAMRVGPAAYLLGNHTKRSMEEIRARPLWLKAQVAWFGLSERFRADPLILPVPAHRTQPAQPVTTNAA
ncbi:MAG: hypothetical protein K0R17_1756 [Rariglobus sp.]|jgi:hypothetical protein|nr:hypothetical protein [Rariglobus sp.]